jgi:hypothetical protein
VELLKDPAARNIAAKIQQLPVQVKIRYFSVLCFCLLSAGIKKNLIFVITWVFVGIRQAFLHSPS